MTCFEGRATSPLVRGLLAGGLLVLLLGCHRETRVKQFPRAPIVLISVDTLRSDHLPAYGYRGVETPHIDALRSDAVLYERVWSHCPMTLPAHVSMFTGLLPTEHGVRNNIGYRFDGEKFETLAEILRRNGYRTGAAVSSYVLRSDTGIDDGFDFYEDAIPIAAAGATSEHQRAGTETLKHATAWLAQNQSEPYFLFFHIYEPHAPYTPPEPYRSRYAQPYDGEVAASDAIVGQLIETLKSSGTYDRAIVIFTSDHGEGLWDHGEDQHGILLYRESLQVPLLIKLPGGVGAESTVSTPTGLSELFFLILDLAGIPRQSAARSSIYAETLYPRIHLGWSELRSIVQGRYHYIESSSPELFDLNEDPAEKNNLIATERRLAAQMRKELQRYPMEIAPVERIDPEEAAKLAALGYVGSPADRTGPLPNPRDQIQHLEAIKAAFRLADQRRLDHAAVALRKLLERNPRLADVWSKLGEVLVDSARFEEAIEVYKSAIAQTERFSADFALGLGFAYLKAGRPSDAIAHAEIAVSSSPREAYELLARSAAELRRFDEAEKYVGLALERGDRQPTTLLLQADVRRAEGDLPGALTTLSGAEARAQELGVHHLYGLEYLRGDILARMDRPEEAIAAYQREIASSPQHLQSYANLAVIYLIQGDRREADRVLEQMAGANPHRGAYLLAAKTLDAFEDRKGAARWRQRAAP